MPLSLGSPPVFSLAAPQATKKAGGESRRLLLDGRASAMSTAINDIISGVMPQAASLLGDFEPALVLALGLPVAALVVRLVRGMIRG